MKCEHIIILNDFVIFLNDSTNCQNAVINSRFKTKKSALEYESFYNNDYSYSSFIN